MNDAHDVPASVVHHVLHEHGLDLLHGFFHFAHARHSQRPERSRLYTHPNVNTTLWRVFDSLTYQHGSGSFPRADQQS